MPRVLWIALGGAAGTCARYYLSAWMLQALGPAFPYGTLTVNLVGSFLLGLLFGIASTTEIIGPTLLLALTTGFLGGFTTYSTFSFDTYKLAQSGAWSLAAGYVAITLVGGLLGTASGFALGGWLVAAPAPGAR